jgi:hypothetical protein
LEELTTFFSSLRFDSPLYFWIGVTLILFLIFTSLFAKRRGLAIDLKYWKQHVSLNNKRFLILSIPVIISSILLAVTLGNPQWLTRSSTLIVGKPVMVLVDVSGSTAGGNKLHPEITGREAADTFESLISLRDDISFGLILFSTENYVARYFTYKNELFVDTLENETAIRRLNRDTNTAPALETAREFLTANIDGDDKAIILISDLNLKISDLEDTIVEIKKDIEAGIDVYLVSTTGNEVYMDRFPDMDGLIVLDIYDTESVAEMYSALSAMETSPINLDESLYQKNLIPYIGLSMLALMVLCIILSETCFKKIP